jgi:hypothetical protein
MKSEAQAAAKVYRETVWNTILSPTEASALQGKEV